MPRDATTAAKNAAAAGHVRVAALVYFDFVSGAVRFASTPQSVTWDSQTWQGLGTFGKVGPVKEGAEQRAYSLDFTLSGLNAGLLATALAEDYQGRDAKMWFAYLDQDHQIIADPVLMFWGMIDTMDGLLGSLAEIHMIVQSRLARWEKAPGLRMNDATQQALYPNDRGLEFAEQMVEKEIVWGSK